MTAERLWLSFVAIYLLITVSSSFHEFSFSVSPIDLIAKSHQSVLWECRAQGEEPITYTWYFEGAVINETDRTVLENGTLEILSVWSRRDSGNYRCCATNPLGVLCSLSVSLTVATLPQFSIDPVSSNVTLGSTGRFSCHTDATPLPMIKWKKDRRILKMTGSYNPRFTMLPDGILQIDNVTQEDAGGYKCRATNLLRSRNSNTAILDVLPPFQGPLPQVPRIVAPPQNLIKKVGEYAVFECLANHPEYEVSWSRQGDEPLRMDGVNYIGRNNLFFINLQLEDSGTYICSVTNKETALSVLAKARLSVYEPPTIQRSDLEDILDMTVGSIARFSCKVSGIPKPTVTWFYQGQPIDPRDRLSIQDNNDLVINGVRAMDRGIYQCMAVNAAGSDMANALLEPSDVVNEPNSPRFLRVNFTTATSIKVVWDPPAAVSNFVAFSVHYQERGGSEEALPVDQNCRSFVIENLKPFTNYVVYAMSWSSEGPSSPSNRVYPQTREAVPRAAPDFFAGSSSQNSIQVAWRELSFLTRNGVIIDYIITYTAEDERHGITVSGEEKQYVITDLKPNTEYKIRMAAATSAGTGVFSSWVGVRTLDSTSDASLPAPMVDVSALNYTAVEIRINLIDEYEDIVGFKVALFDDEGVTVKDLLIPADNLIFSVGGLKPATTYEVHVQAYNDEEEGHIASGTVATFSQPVCSNGFPPQFNLTSTSPRTMFVTWQQSLTDSLIQGYTIRYSTAMTNVTMAEIPYKIRGGDRPPHHLEIGNLEPYTKYQVEIRVHIPNCSGLFGSSKFVWTLQDLPSSVAEVEADPLDPFSIRLTWQSPKKPNGIITHYVIAYNDNRGSPEEEWIKVQQNASHERSITNLKSNTVYYFRVQAGTGVGEGPPTNPPVMAKTPLEELVEPQNGWSDEQMGIMIGVVLALISIIICCTFLLIRFRNPRRDKGNVSVVSSKEEHPHGSFICSGNCHQVEGTYMLDRVSGDDDDVEVLRPMLSNGHIILSSQRIHQNGRQVCPVTSETLNLESDLSNHSASSGFVDSSSQAEEIPVSKSAIKHSDDTPQTPEAVPLTTVDLVPAQQCATQGYAGHSQDTVFADSIPDDGSGGHGKRHMRYMDPEMEGRSREIEVPLLERMLRSTVPGETQV